MKSKLILITGDKQEQFIRIIASRFGVSADNELKLISIFCKYDMFQPFHLDKYTRMKLIKEIGCNDSTFATILSRLVNANVIARNGKTLFFNVAFRELDEIDSIVFRYSPIKETSATLQDTIQAPQL